MQANSSSSTRPGNIAHILRNHCRLITISNIESSLSNLPNNLVVIVGSLLRKRHAPVQKKSLNFLGLALSLIEITNWLYLRTFFLFGSCASTMLCQTQPGRLVIDKEAGTVIIWWLKSFRPMDFHVTTLHFMSLSRESHEWELYRDAQEQGWDLFEATSACTVSDFSQLLEEFTGMMYTGATSCYICGKISNQLESSNIDRDICTIMLWSFKPLLRANRGSFTFRSLMWGSTGLPRPSH